MGDGNRLFDRSTIEACGRTTAAQSHVRDQVKHDLRGITKTRWIWLWLGKFQRLAILEQAHSDCPMAWRLVVN